MHYLNSAICWMILTVKIQVRGNIRSTDFSDIWQFIIIPKKVTKPLGTSVLQLRFSNKYISEEIIILSKNNHNLGKLLWMKENHTFPYNFSLSPFQSNLLNSLSSIFCLIDICMRTLYKHGFHKDQERRE